MNSAIDISRMIDTLNPTARGTRFADSAAIDDDDDDDKANNVLTVDGNMDNVLEEIDDIEVVIVDPLVVDDLLVGRVVGKNVPFSTVIE